ncbi:MAG: flavodoxin family protein [Chloroflexota bacterium]
MMKGQVIYDSAYGNTEKVARAIGEALRAQHDVEVRHISNVDIDQLASLDFIVIGGPTQRMNYTEHMRDFLAKIPLSSLSGVKAAVFDTRISIKDIESTVGRLAARVFLHRYAASQITAALEKRDVQLVMEPEGFFVLDTEGPLKDGELVRAANWAQQVGAVIESV